MRTGLIAAIVMLLLPVAAVCAQEPYFCCRQGAELHYERSHASGGALKWRHTMKISSVSSTGAGVREVDYSSRFTKPGGAAMYGGPVALHAVVGAGGNVTMSVSSTLESVFRNLFPNAEIRSEGGETVLPAAMKPGDTLPDVFSSVTVKGLRYTVSVTERKVLRTETLHTPAGVFDCIVLSEHKVEKGPGRNRNTVAQTWYARGTGMVRHDTYERGKLDTVELLVSAD